MKSPKKLFFLGVLILFLALVIFAMWPRDRVGDLAIPDLASQLTRDLDDWTWEDRPLAETPEMLEVIDEQLTFDTAIYRIYQRGNLAVAVYVGYWLPGKKDFRSILVHVPDICWPASGWAVHDQNDSFVLETQQGPLVEGQLRTMRLGESEVDLVFWMLVNGKPIKYTTGNSVNDLVRDLTSISFLPTEGFYFIRISTNKSLEILKEDPDFQKIVDGVAGVGLYPE